MIIVPPLPLAGDELRVPCADGGQRRYLSLDAAAATGALPSVLEAVQAFVPWYASMQGAAGYKSQASAIACECARLAALTPRVFRTGNPVTIYAAACISSSSSMTSCGVL